MLEVHAPCTLLTVVLYEMTRPIELFVVTPKHVHFGAHSFGQDKAQKLELVRESLGALKAPPKTPTTLSPVDSRRKAAAMHVLRACTKA